MKKIILLIGIVTLLLISGCDKQEQSICVDKNCSNLVINNSSTIFKNITAMFVIDCSLPEYYGNGTVEIVYGEAIYNNTNVIEIPFIEFCKRLESK